jgi:hypothetical protein
MACKARVLLARFIERGFADTKVIFVHYIHNGEHDQSILYSTGFSLELMYAQMLKVSIARLVVVSKVLE